LIGVEDEFKGVVDLLYWRVIYNEAVKGSTVVISKKILESALELAKEKRTELVAHLADVDEEFGELFRNNELPSNAQIAEAIRSTIIFKFSPVFPGSANKNTAVHPLLDSVCAYLQNLQSQRFLFVILICQRLLLSSHCSWC